MDIGNVIDIIGMGSFGSNLNRLFPKARKNDMVYTKNTHRTIKWSFPLPISSVNVTKSAENCGFGHGYWRDP